VSRNMSDSPVPWPTSKVQEKFNEEINEQGDRTNLTRVPRVYTVLLGPASAPELRPVNQGADWAKNHHTFASLRKDIGILS
jgi:hypothetical protein